MRVTVNYYVAHNMLLTVRIVLNMSMIPDDNAVKTYSYRYGQI